MSIETGEVQLETMTHKRNPKHGLTLKTSTYSVVPSQFANTPANNGSISDNTSTHNLFPPPPDPRHMFELHEQKRWNHLLKNLPEKLESPYQDKPKPKKKRLPKHLRNDPVRKILAVNKTVQKKKYAYNERLLRILERLEYDRPILMRDKLDVIWEKAPQKPKEGDTPLTTINYEDPLQLGECHSENED